MKILMLTTHLNPGGISRYVINLAKGLNQRNHRVWVACSGGEWLNQLENAGALVKLIPINTKSIFSLKILFSLISLMPLLAQERFDIIHCNTRATQALGWLIQRWYNIPYISVYHGFYQPNIGRRLFPFSGKKTIAVSNAVKKHLTSDLKIPAEQIDVIHNGIDLTNFETKQLTRQQLGFKQDEVLIGILGRISEEKGHFLAAESFTLLGPHYIKTRLMVNGKGKLENSFKAYLEKLDITNRASLLGLTAQDFLAIIDVLLVPSKKEGFGYSIIEAFACNIPVIAYATGGITEIIKDQENGLLFNEYDPINLKNKIEQLLADPALRKKIIANAKASLAAYTLQQMALNTEKFYESIIS